MSVYVITVEWNEDQMPVSTSLERLLNSNFKWVHLTKDSYLIVSVNNSVEIRNYITEKIQSIKRIFIGEMKYSAAWRNMLTDSETIKQIFENE